MKLSERLKPQSNCLTSSDFGKKISPGRLTGVLKNHRTTLRRLWEIYNDDLMTTPEQIALMTRHENANEELIEAICKMYCDNAEVVVALFNECNKTLHEILIPLVVRNLNTCKRFTPYKTFEEWENVRKAALKQIYRLRLYKHYSISTLSYRDCIELQYIADTFGAYDDDNYDDYDDDETY